MYLCYDFPMIKTVIFDIGNVLMRFEWHEYMQDHYDPDTIQVINENIWGSGWWNELDRGVLSEEEIFAHFTENAPEYRKEILEACENVAECMHRCEYAIPWIQELREKGYQVLYLSNYSDYLIRKCPEVLDFLPYADGGVFSYRVKYVKPQPEIYHCLSEKYDLKPEECVFLDDNITNIDAANHLGFHTVHFTNYDEVYKKLSVLLKQRGAYEQSL